MWTRKELKDKAKGALKANYWRTVLVGLLLLAIAGGVSSYSSIYSAPLGMTNGMANANNNIVHVDNDDVTVNIDGDQIHVSVKDDGEHSSGSAGVFDEGKHHSDVRDVNVSLGPAVALFGLTMLLVGLVVSVIAIAFYAFIFNPVEVGAMRFFLRNLNKPAEVKEIAYAYDNNYLETVKTIFLRDLFIFLWSLLLIVPGIVKAYEYRMIPYLMAEDPTMTRDLAFAESKRMMTGQKWNTFVLDLSFIGWYILSAFTLGILAIFYVAPYQNLTNAALYEKLRYGAPAPQPQAYNPYGQPPVQPGPGQPNQPTQPWQQSQPMQPVQPVQPVQPTQPMQPTQPVQQVQPMNQQPGPIDVTPAASAQETAPVIASATQPPVPPFAAEGAEPASEGDETANDEGDSPQE